MQLTSALVIASAFGVSGAFGQGPVERPVPDAADAPTVNRRDPVVRVDGRSSVHQDTDRTTIITANTTVRGAPSERVGVEARYLVDMITSASVDVVTAATGAFHETRNEAQGGADYHDDYRKLAASYVYSIENDWSSHTGNASYQQDVAGHDITLRIAGTAVANRVGRSGDPNFHKQLTTVGGTTGITFVVTPEDLLDLGYTLSYGDGYQASPYRFVGVRGVSVLALGQPETHPNLRMRHAVTLRFNHHMFKDTVLRSHARGYVDDWGVKSITGGTEYVVGFGAVEAGAFVRGYAQGRADFYQAEYARPMRYMTADRELATFVDAFGGGRLRWLRERWGAFDDLHVEAKVTGFVFEFSNFPRLRERSGIIGEVALGVAF